MCEVGMTICNLLSNAFLEGQKEGYKFTIKRPGTLHTARLMEKLIYCIKICLLEEQIREFPRSMITTKGQSQKVREFVNFATLIYSVWWMTCSSAVDAPWNDLIFFQSLLNYPEVNPHISKSAVSSFKRHLWYLTEEMVPFALWSKNVE